MWEMFKRFSPSRSPHVSICSPKAPYLYDSRTFDVLFSSRFCSVLRIDIDNPVVFVINAPHPSGIFSHEQKQQPTQR